MKKRVLTITFVILCLFSYSLESKYLLGIIINRTDKTPVPFATIKYESNNLGVISNENGSFKIPIIDSLKMLEVRCIGFHTLKIDVSKVKANSITHFYLAEKKYLLNEITIKDKKLKPESSGVILLKAINKIKENYLSIPSLVEGYYRDYVKYEDQYFNLYESLVQLEDLGIKKEDFETTKIKELYGKMNDDYEIIQGLIKQNYDEFYKRIPGAEMRYVGSNELSILRLSDPIRNFNKESFDYIGCLKDDFLENHDFYPVSNIVFEDNKSLYEINFELSSKYNIPTNIYRNFTKYSVTKIEVKGRIYIEHESYTIKKIVYRLYTTNQAYGKVKAWELNLEYKTFKNKNYLNYLSFNNIIEIIKPGSKNFYIKSIHPSEKGNMLTIEFNNTLDPKNIKKIQKLKLKFKNQELSFTSGKIKENKLYLNLGNIFFELPENEKGKNLINDFNIEFPNSFADINNNKINSLKRVLAYQYREFFVTDILDNYVPLKATECLSKWESLIKQTNENVDKEIVFNSPLLK